MSEAESINIPKLLVVIILTFLAARWYLSKPSSGAGGSGARGTRHGNEAATRNRVNPAHVEQVMEMFPTVDRRAVMWDLQRNGGSVQATTERLLGGRGLEVVSHLIFFGRERKIYGRFTNPNVLTRRGGLGGLWKTPPLSSLCIATADFSTSASAF
jgi:hypothetical protein